MRRFSFAVTVSLIVLLVPGVGGAHQGSHGGFHSGPGRVFVHHGHPHPFHPHHQVFIHPEFTHPHVFATFAVVAPAPRWVWVPGFRHWNGFQWVWIPGHWAW